MSRIDHDGRETLLDHIPIVGTFVFKEEPNTGMRKDSYMKLNHRMLTDPIILERIQLAWDNRKHDGVDACISWELGCREIRVIMKEEKLKRLATVPSKEQLEQELMELGGNRSV